MKFIPKSSIRESKITVIAGTDYYTCMYYLIDKTCVDQVMLTHCITQIVAAHA